MNNDDLLRQRLRQLTLIHDFTLRLIYLLGVHPGRVTSWLRSVAGNKHVAGRPDSYHLEGCAADIVLDDGHQNAACVETARAVGLDTVDEGDHVHVELDHRRTP